MRTVWTIAGVILAACAVARAETVALQVESAIAEQDPHTKQEVVNVQLTPEGRHGLAEFTRDRVGRTIHLRVDGVLLVSPTLASPLDGGALQLSSGQTGFVDTTAQDIARRLNGGSPLELSDEP